MEKETRRKFLGRFAAIATAVAATACIPESVDSKDPIPLEYETWGHYQRKYWFFNALPGLVIEFHTERLKALVEKEEFGLRIPDGRLATVVFMSPKASVQETGKFLQDFQEQQIKPALANFYGGRTLPNFLFAIFPDMLGQTIYQELGRIDYNRLSQGVSLNWVKDIRSGVAAIVSGRTSSTSILHSEAIRLILQNPPITVSVINEASIRSLPLK